VSLALLAVTPGAISAVTVIAWPVAAGLGLIAKVAEAASATFPEKQPSATTASAERKFLTISPPKYLPRKPLLNKKALETLQGSPAVSRLRVNSRKLMGAEVARVMSQQSYYWVAE
jgi:hypothetical protein